jgi:hypothetical protein
MPSPIAELYGARPQIAKAGLLPEYISGDRLSLAEIKSEHTDGVNPSLAAAT